MTDAELRDAIEFYLRTGRSYSGDTPTTMRDAAMRITGRKYTRTQSGLRLASRELTQWIDAHAALQGSAKP